MGSNVRITPTHHRPFPQCLPANERGAQPAARARVIEAVGARAALPREGVVLGPVPTDHADDGDTEKTLKPTFKNFHAG